MRGDRWISSCPENIYVTYLCFFPKNKGNLFFYTPLVVALSITKTLEELGLSPEIKWINDAVVYKKKIAGILCEWIPSDHPEYFIRSIPKLFV
ncbi:MAG: hypothetical protein H6620_09785 [Halobacteriovoraceae bacterium]|nr:hypothetical protein [Halobacteriovoraceae bacterium]